MKTRGDVEGGGTQELLSWKQREQKARDSRGEMYGGKRRDRCVCVCICVGCTKGRRASCLSSQWGRVVQDSVSDVSLCCNGKDIAYDTIIRQKDEWEDRFLSLDLRDKHKMQLCCVLTECPL